MRFPANGFGASIVYVLAGHSGVYVGKARLDRKENVWHGSESDGTPACVAVHTCS